MKNVASLIARKANSRDNLNDLRICIGSDAKNQIFSLCRTGTENPVRLTVDASGKYLDPNAAFQKPFSLTPSDSPNNDKSAASTNGFFARFSV
jgi:hypothetical protein